MGKTERPPKQSCAYSAVLKPDDVLPDSALASGERDEFDHRSIASKLAQLALAVQAPANIALFGPWGSGKSSVYDSIRTTVNANPNQAAIARYDAWKYGGKSLKRNFVASISEQLGTGSSRDPEHLYRNEERNELQLGLWLRKNWASILIGLALAVGLAAGWLVLISWIGMLLRQEAFKAQVAFNLAGAGSFLGITLAALIVGPKVLESVNVKLTRPAPEGDDEFSKEFENLASRITKSGKRRLIVFIDELDRCAPADVVSTLIDLKTFLDQPGCVFVVAADRDVLEKSLQEVPQAKPVRPNDPYYSTPGEFIDKIFQHQVALPPLRSYTLTRFARSLVLERAGLWAELRALKSLDEVVYTLVPKHVRSPRRVKVLLNAFATNVRIAQARGIDGLGRATEIAKLTVLQTEFASFATELQRFPKLAGWLLEADVEGGDEALREAVERYLPRFTVATDSDLADPGSPSGELIASPGDSNQQEAENQLKVRLVAYLRRARAAGIPDPRPDLIYVQGAGPSEGLDDPRFGEAIDLAADTDPAEVLQELDGAKTADIITAVRLLAEKSDSEFGPGRTNLIEIACRLAEKLGADELRGISRVASPSVFVVVNDDERAEMLPGALLIGTAAGAFELVNRVLAKVENTTLDNNLQGRLLPALLELPAEKMEVVGRILLQFGPVDQFCSALRQLPEQKALLLWESTKSKFNDLLVEIATPPAASTDPSTPSRATGSPASSRTREEGDTTPAEAADMYGSVLRSAVGRDESSSALLEAVVEFGQDFERSPAEPLIQGVLRAQAETFMARLDVDARDEVATKAIAYGDAADWDWWLGHLTHGQERDDRLLKTVSKRGYAELEDENSAHHESVIKVFSALELSGGLSAEATGVVVSDLVGLLLGIGWNSSTVIRRRAVWESVSYLADGSDAVTMSALADDVVRGAGQVGAGSANVFSLIDSVGVLAQEAAEVAEPKVASMTTEVVPAVLKARIQIALRVRARMVPLPASAVVEVGSAAGGRPAEELVSEWLNSVPPIDSVVEIAGSPLGLPEGAVGDFVERISQSDATRLWISLADADRPPSLLRIAGSLGIGVPEVEKISARVESQARQADRDRTIDQLRTAAIEDPKARVAAGELAIHLLDDSVQGNIRLGVKIIEHLNGAPRGLTDQIRASLESAAERSPEVFKGAIGSRLRELNLLRKKSLLDRIFG
ncbi:KAP family NTPase [Pseudonocardia sp. RS11V-5]|uniref:P-loop NTPase fold protein n=1 Tax=Pseudonocardia terrae TaxID=2905831 RepID=UPI001E60D5C8|nr:P-loop NTPase fold protein [Pseudonocardia terrae]MCE3552828.1 KAP family NTPase [Pseudonocardia terrae]